MHVRTHTSQLHPASCVRHLSPSSDLSGSYAVMRPAQPPPGHFTRNVRSDTTDAAGCICSLSWQTAATPCKSPVHPIPCTSAASQRRASGDTLPLIGAGNPNRSFLSRNTFALNRRRRTHTCTGAVLRPASVSAPLFCSCVLSPPHLSRTGTRFCPADEPRFLRTSSVQ